MRSEYRKKQEAKERAAKALQKTKKRLGIKPARSLQGAKESPLLAKGWTRRPRTAPTSDRIPGSAASRDFMHTHKWKRGATETEATVKECVARLPESLQPITRALCNTYRTTSGLMSACRKQTSVSPSGTSAKCQKRTSSPAFARDHRET